MADQTIQQAKACSKCGAVKPLSEFAKSKQTCSGVRAACKSCCSAREAERLRAKGIGPLKVTMPCEDCGQSFVRTAPLRTRCDPCREVHRKLQARAAGRRTYQRNPKRVRNPEERRAANKRYAERNREKVIEAYRRYNEANREEINRKSRERNRTDKRRNYMREWDRQYRAIPRNRLDQRMKTAVAIALKGGKNGRSWEKLVGFTLTDLVKHIERQFLPGMSWENMGEWHIDHVLPLASFSYDDPHSEEFRAAWALTNLRPLWWRDNIAKGAKRLFLV